MAMPAEAARGVLGSLLRDFPSPLGPEDPLPWSAQGSAALSRAEAPGELAELARRFLGGRDAPPLLASSLIHAAIDEVLQTDLSVFKKQSVEGEEEGDQGKFTLLDGGSLQRCFFNKLRDICCEWQKQLPSLKSLKRFLIISSHAIRNVRRKMEDRHVSLPEFNQLFGLSDDVDRAYFAVFDGHGGVDAANYAATHLHVNVALHKEILKNPTEALKGSFQQTDEMFLFKAERERLRSGTTGVSALIVGNRLHIAWVGDSQVMLVQQGKAVTLMEPHKPEREDERMRIEALGGCVTYMDCWRVNGTLAVSRAIAPHLERKNFLPLEPASKFLCDSDNKLHLNCWLGADALYNFVQSDSNSSGKIQICGLMLQISLWHWEHRKCHTEYTELDDPLV
ncbi:protein phosphatase 1F isoform X2 [Malaclemys terrapin pileata]|uniref:protein phosphatase 1F isoform X2 n=1 Tax=Malaclemys terrapin pileata TaxID=2991368 RepID=UPI0023A7F86C|nr:protein phosphatase 1F isoform X2 [Malaclemys terrapin pileata]